ncbi:MAG: hypothetical protein R3F62_08945 [Planctomycetota bacterium]
MTHELLQRWRDDALRLEASALEAYLRDGLEAGPARGLRALAVTAGVLELDAPTRARALELAGAALAAKEPEPRWDAVHVAHLAGLRELEDPLGDELGAGEAWIRGRACEACAALNLGRFRAQLDSLRTEDEDWTVRRLVADALRLGGKVGPERDPFARLRALLRTGVLESESGAKTSPDALSKFGLRLPPAFAALLCDVFGGGRLRYAKGRLAGRSVSFVSPMQLATDLEATHQDDVSKLHDYVWARYVEGERGYPDLDEDAALARYAARYDAGLIDKDAWNYGVLLFESAYRDEERRAEHLLRCRSVLEAYKRLVPEAWDVVDDRLEEARETLDDEQLWATPDAPRITVGAWEGVVQVRAELYRGGVWSRESEDGEDAPAGPALLAFLNDPRLDEQGQGKPPATRADQALELLEACSQHMDAGTQRKAGRAFGDALEIDASAEVVNRAAGLLTREDLTPLGAAQLLSTIPLAGDKPSMKVVRQALLACPAELALQVLEAAAPYDEPDSQIALVIDVAASLRNKSHAAVSELARRLKQERGTRNSRTVRNPWYGK